MQEITTLNLLCTQVFLLNLDYQIGGTSYYILPDLLNMRSLLVKLEGKQRVILPLDSPDYFLQKLLV